LTDNFIEIVIKIRRKSDSFQAHKEDLMDKKLAGLIKKRDAYKVKLIEMYKHFHGVKHESAHSELQYSEIKVYEDMLNSVVNEISKLAASQ